MKSLAPLALVLASCSAFKDSSQCVTVRCDDPAAELFANNRSLGFREARVFLPRWHAHNLRAVAPDGRNSTEVIFPTLAASAWWDILGGIIFWIPAIGLVTDGVFDLSSTDVQIILPKPSPAAANP